MNSNRKVVSMHPKSQRRILITHTDLDGVGCAVIYSKCFPGVEACFVNYNEVNEVVMQIISEDFTTPIMISDMSVNEEVAHLLDVRGKVQLIDHHSTAKWLEKYEWAVVDTSRCATYLMYNIFSTAFVLKDYEDFATLVDNYDRWGAPNPEPDPRSYDFNRLLYIMGRERFYKRFATLSTLTLSPVEISLLEIDKEKEAEYIQDSIESAAILTDQNGYKYALTIADQYTSALGHAMLNASQEIEYVIMLDFRSNKASLRSKGNVNVAELAKQVGGGGHPKAAGFPLSDTATTLFSPCPTCAYKQFFSEYTKSIILGTELTPEEAIKYDPGHSETPEE